MIPSFEDWAKNLRVAWRDIKGRAMLGSLGFVLGDKAKSEGNAALLEQLPLNASDPASIALGLSERQIEAGPALSLSDEQALAGAAPNLNRLRGRPLGLLCALYYAGFPSAIVVQQNGLAFQLTGTPNLNDLAGLVALPGWCSRTVLPLANPPIPASADGKAAIPALTVPWWTFDGGMDANGNQYCSRFAILFTSGTDPLLLSTAQARIKRIIAAWRPAKAKPVGIWVLTSGHMWGQPGLVWGGFNWGGTVTSYAAE